MKMRPVSLLPCPPTHIPSLSSSSLLHFLSAILPPSHTSLLPPPFPPPFLPPSLPPFLPSSPSSLLPFQECTNLCCNATTCQLASGAECSTGSCCDLSTCQMTPYGTTCRASTGQCDITEFCLGDSQDCPVDTYLRDGTSCNGNQDYCFEGTCQTLDSQCQFHFSEQYLYSVVQC